MIRQCVGAADTVILTVFQWTLLCTDIPQSLGHTTRRFHTGTFADSPCRRSQKDRGPRSGGRYILGDTDRSQWGHRSGPRSHTRRAACSQDPNVSHHRLKGKDNYETGQHCAALYQSHSKKGIRKVGVSSLSVVTKGWGNVVVNLMCYLK